MWCPSCRADVAAELSTDNRRMMCARCHTDIGVAAGASIQIAAAPRSNEAERDARELLARWSAQNVLEPVAALKPMPSSLGQGDAPQLPPSDLRFDPTKSAAQSPTSPFLTAVRERPTPVLQMSSTGAAQNAKTPTSTNPTQANLSPNSSGAQVPPVSAPKQESHPHDNSNRWQASNAAGDQDQLVHDAIQQTGRRRTGWFSLAGQLCAFAGVGLLTCGTVLVMWSYFGGPGRYMPTGWLIAAVGQMLLFLGVIALISSGLDQSSYEVGWRVDHLAEEIHSMSLALKQLERRLKNESMSDSGDSQIQDAA